MQCSRTIRVGSAAKADARVFDKRLAARKCGGCALVTPAVVVLPQALTASWCSGETVSPVDVKLFQLGRQGLAMPDEFSGPDGVAPRNSSQEIRPALVEVGLHVGLSSS
jgi:hypothetical protein